MKKSSRSLIVSIMVICFVALFIFVIVPDYLEDFLIKYKHLSISAALVTFITLAGYIVTSSYKVVEVQNTVIPVVEENKEEPVVEVAPIVEEIVPVVEEDDEEDDILRLDYSFKSKVILASDETKEFYKEILNYVETFGVKIRRSWKKETIYVGRNVFALLTFKGKKLCVSFALDPKDYVESKYFIKDVSDVKKYEKTPSLMKITSPRKVKYTKELLDLIFVNNGLVNKNVEVNPKEVYVATKEELIEQGYIKDPTRPEIETAKDLIPVYEVVAPVVKEIVPIEINDIEVDDEETPGIVRLDYSFKSKLMLSNDEVKEYYKEIVGYAEAFGVKIRKSWKKETVYKGRTVFALLTFKGKKLCVSFALDPKDFENSKYFFKDVSNVKKYEKTPVLMKITSNRKVKYTKELFNLIFTNNGLENKNLTVEAIEIPIATKEELIEQGLIKDPKKVSA